MKRSPLPLALILAFPAGASAQEKITWQDHIRPIFENRCNNCHNADKKKGDLNLATFAGVMAGGSGGASVEAGDSAGSTLWKVASHLEEPLMPPKGDKIPQAELDLIAKWIQGGLLDSPDSTAKVKKKAAFGMSASATAAKPEGPPPMPEHLLREPVVVPERPNAVLALAHSPWAPLAALAAPRQVLLYHSTTGELLGVLPFPEGGTPETLSFSRNGALLLAGGGIAGKQGLVVVWDVKTGQVVINLPMAEDFDTVLAADISADLSRVAMGGPGRRVRIYDTRSSQLIANIKKHTDWVTSLAFSPDGVLLASGDRNGGLYVWEAGTGNEFYNLRGHEKMIGSLAWRGDSNLLAAGSEDGTATWWEMAGGSQVKKITSHGGVLALGFAPDGRMISGGRDGHARIWDGNGAAQRDWVPSGGSAVLKAVFSDDGKRVLTGSWNGEVKSWDAAQAEAVPTALLGNPPSISTRLAGLTGEVAGQRAAAEKGAAGAAAAEQAAAAAEAEFKGRQAAVAALPEQRAGVAAQLEKGRASLAALGAGAEGYRQALAAARQEQASAAPAAPAGAGPGPGEGVPAGVVAAREQVARAEASLFQLSQAFLGKKVSTLEQIVQDCEGARSLQEAALAKATQEAARLEASLAEMSAQLPLQEQAVAAAKQQVAAAQGARAAAQAALEAGQRTLAQWQAADLLKPALVLRAEARTLKEKVDDLQAELAPLEAAVSTPPAPRLEELRQQLAALPAEAAARQKAADEAWQAYLNLLPK